MTDRQRLRNLQRRVNRAKGVTCAASRHVHEIADRIMRGDSFEYQRELCAESIYAVLEDLWKLRAELRKAKQ